MDSDPERILVPQWAPELIVLSYCISWLGAYTSFQLHIHAQYTKNGWVWTMLGSIAFGFCAIWSMHFLGMLACHLDINIKFDIPLTILSAVVAVGFTFFAFLSSNEDFWKKVPRAFRKFGPNPPSSRPRATSFSRSEDIESQPLTAEESENTSTTGEPPSEYHDDYFPEVRMPAFVQSIVAAEASEDSGSNSSASSHFLSLPYTMPRNFSSTSSPSTATTPEEHWSSDDSIRVAIRHHTRARLDASSRSLDSNISIISMTWCEWIQELVGKISLHQAVRAGIWASAIVFMHYCGMWAMEIPEGRIEWNLWIVGLSFLVAYLVCFVACLVMYRMEVHFKRQIAVSTIASAGVCLMHYTGMSAATIYTRAPPSPDAGYPSYLSFTIISIAIFVCVVSNAILADSAIMARVRMAEMILTKRRLWRVMAEKEAAERARELKQQFISVASHEIRTPLHTVNGYADLLVRSNLSSEQMLYVNSIQQACNAINVIAGNVLDFNKLERNNVELEATPVLVDLRKMLEGVSKLAAAGDADIPTVDTVISVAPRVPTSVYLDETYALRVFMNLYSNAQKFTPNGYISIKVDLDSEHQNLVALVSDTGCGIPADFREAIFEPFRQVDGSMRRAHQGAGLGLSIVKHLVQRMRGTVEVESTEGEGSTFKVTVPITNQSDTPLESPPAPSPKRRIKVAYTDKRTQKLFVDLWKQLKQDASTVSLHHSTAELWKETDVLWTDVGSLKSSMTLRSLMSSSPPSMTSSTRVVSICVIHSTPDELLALEPSISAAKNIILIKRPIVMHSVLHMLDNPEEQSNMYLRSYPPRVRFAFDTEFTKNSPPKGAKTDADIPLVTTSRPSQVSQKSKETGSDSKGKVLLVEDNLINQRLGKRLVEKLGYEVVTASHGREAVEAVKKEKFDVCLMDCQMPILDGFAATQEIRALEESGKLSGRLRIVALTANVTADSEEKCRASGMDAFLPKPLRIDDLEMTLQQPG